MRSVLPAGRLVEVVIDVGVDVGALLTPGSADALEIVEGDLSDNHSALRAALATNIVDAPYGPIALDDNRQAIVDTFVAQLVLDGDEVVQQTVAIIPGVDQTFGGTYSSDTAPPERDNTPCEAGALPWHGNAIPVIDGVPQD